jgi:protein-disulfide isomerase
LTRLRKPVDDDDHRVGSSDAPAILLEYGDYECPHCRNAHAVVTHVRARMGDGFLYVFRNFPLEKIHPHALAAAQAAEAAGAQGQFWPMHSMLFEHQDALESEDLVAYASELALDVARFVEELRRGAYLARIAEDFRSGVRSGVNGTPTFFVNENRFDEPSTVESLTASLARAAAHEQRKAEGRTGHPQRSP